MPDRAISILSCASAALVAGYLMLVVVTVTLAAWQTNLAVSVHETEQEIARLEARYYAMVAEIDRTDPSALGLTKPANVIYAAASAAPAVSLR